jgi:hypothetical protein
MFPAIDPAAEEHGVNKKRQWRNQVEQITYLSRDYETDLEQVD